MTRIRSYVGIVFMLAVFAAMAAWQYRGPEPNLWDLGTFCLAALLLEQAGGPLRVGANGSTSFIAHLAAGLLFGPFWGAAVAGISTVLSQIAFKNPPIKVVFNASQRIIAVSLSVMAYSAVGGNLPPAYLTAVNGLFSADARLDLVYFFVLATVYFALNAVAVNAAVAISSGQRFREVWNLNVRGVLGYDLAASFLAVALAWLYVRFAETVGFGAIGFALVLAPIMAIRHIYGLYRKLQSSGRELLDLMVKAIEARDPYTSGHSVRVATLARAIAQEAKMSSEEVEEVFTAAVLHDVGKIHEEFAPLLRKDSKLTPEETALLQTHSVKSAELVGIISSFRGTVQDAVRSHHERWDGGGYPDGLAGEAIPLGARIIMISDTTDAMTTDRPYRGRLPIEAVIAELQKYRGSQFDPRLVDMVVNSVSVRRVMSELSASPQRPAEPGKDGGSKRVQSPQGLLRGRASWPRIRAF